MKYLEHFGINGLNMIKNLLKLTVIEELGKTLEFGKKLLLCQFPNIEISDSHSNFHQVIKEINKLSNKKIYLDEKEKFISIGFFLFEFDNCKFITKTSKTLNRNNEEHYILNLFCVGSRNNLLQFLKHCSSIFDSPDIFCWNNNWMRLSNSQSYKTFDKIYCKEEIKSEILDDLQRFKESEDRYIEEGITYKRNYLFYGPPGTGKTSLAKAIATHLKRPLYIFPLEKTKDTNSWNNDAFVDGLSWMSSSPVILIEDIDHAYDTQNPGDSLLNLLDGMRSIKDSVTIITTNNLDNINPILIRPGRIDKTFFLDHPGLLEISKLIEDLAPERFTDKQKELIFLNFHISEIQNYLIQKGSVEKILLELVKRLENGNK